MAAAIRSDTGCGEGSGSISFYPIESAEAELAPLQGPLARLQTHCQPEA